jgi:hypothetical protein
MSDFHYAAERLLDAPADVIYHCLVDYQTHHRHQPDGFLPTAFTKLDVLQGGVGAGTVIRFSTQIGGRTEVRTQQVSEPEPGHVLVEAGSGESSRFTVEPRPGGTLVRIETVLQTRGLNGLALKLFGRRILAPLYEDELKRLEQYAQSHTN